MSGSESESLGAIVLNENIMRITNTAKKAAADSETIEKQCSACRHHKSIKEFIGSTPRHEGQEMRTCAECRERNRKIPLGNNSKEPMGYFREPRSAKRFEPVEVESGRNGRATRRQTTSPTRATMGRPSRSSSAVRRPSTPFTTPFTTPVTTRKSRNSLAAAASAAATTPVSTHASPRVSVVSRDEDNTDGAESDEEYYQPPPATKRRSTPHSANEDVDQEDQEDAIQVRPPAPKRQRTRAPSIVRREPEVERVEDEASAPNANEQDVGANLAAFATSLGRLSQLLINAGKSLDNERIGALECEIHHDWRVDEMATFVEGFLKGASAKTGGRGW